jgi:hypothetical protein
MTAQPMEWTTFECDGRTFEYMAMPTKHKTRPAGWPSHKRSPGPWVLNLVGHSVTQRSLALLSQFM